jgi:hypothetical protein
MKLTPPLGIALVAIMVLCFLAGAAFAIYKTDYRAEVEGLRERVRETELTMWQWRGELDALQKIGVEVKVVDTSVHANVIAVRNYEQEAAQ